jgi:hypothetical protein
MSILRFRPRFLRRWLRRNDPLSARDPAWGDDAEYRAPAGDAPAVTYEPHGIDTPETLADLVAQADADARAAQASAETGQWFEGDEPGIPLAPVPGVLPLPPMPYSPDMSRIMVGQIAYPDPADLTPDRNRAYRDMLRRVGVATGTHTSLEDTGMWALPALEPGDGTGVQL